MTALTWLWTGCVRPAAIWLLNRGPLKRWFGKRIHGGVG